MSGLMKGPRLLWDRMRTLRRIARVTFKVGLIFFVCLAVVYSIARVILFSHYGSKLKGEMARFEAAGGSTHMPQLVASGRVGRAPALILAAGMLYEDPGSPPWRPLRRPTPEETDYDARASQAWERYGEWRGFNLHRTEHQSLAEHGRQAAGHRPWNKAWLPFLDDHLGNNAITLSLLKQAAEIGEGTFEVNWPAGYAAQMRHLSDLRSGARLLRTDAVVKAARGEITPAMENVRLTFRLQRLIADESSIISRLVSYACGAIACSSLQGVLEFGTPGSESLKALLDELDGREDTYRLTPAFIMETAVALNAFEHVSRNPTYIDELMGTVGGPSRLPARRHPWFADFVIGAGIKLLWVEPADRYHYLSMMNTFIEASQKGLPEALDVSYPMPPASASSAPFRLMTMMLTPAPSRAIVQQAVATARVRLARTVLALTLYKLDRGAYPDTLDPLVPDYLTAPQIDPFDGKPLRYTKKAEGFVVYSVGKNKLDDEGVYADSVGENGDIAWER